MSKTLDFFRKELLNSRCTSSSLTMSSLSPRRRGKSFTNITLPWCSTPWTAERTAELLLSLNLPCLLRVPRLGEMEPKLSGFAAANLVGPTAFLHVFCCLFVWKNEGDSKRSKWTWYRCSINPEEIQTKHVLSPVNICETIYRFWFAVSDESKWVM